MVCIEAGAPTECAVDIAHAPLDADKDYCSNGSGQIF